MTVPVEGLSTEKLHVAWPLVSLVVGAVDCRGRAEEAHRRGGLVGLLQRDQRGELRVHVDLLLDARELHQLLGELVGVERIERVLVLAAAW